MKAIRLSLAAGALAFGGILSAQAVSGDDVAAPAQPLAEAAVQAPAVPGPAARDGSGPDTHLHMHRHHRHDRHGHRGGFMKRMDGDRDGKLSRDEVLAAQQRQLAMFDRADADKDGALTRDEMRAARDAMRAEHRKRSGDLRRDGAPRAPQAPAASPKG